MPTKLSDWKCQNCDSIWEHLAHGEDQVPEFCPCCGDLRIEPTNTGGNITKCHDPEAKKEILKKRSIDHSRRLVAKEAGHRGSLPKDFGRRKLR